jgi:hypothetical protein
MAFRRGLKIKNWPIEAKPTWHHFGGKINWFGPKKELQGELMIWRMKVKARVQHASNQFASNESKLVPKNKNPGPHLVLSLILLQVEDFSPKHIIFLSRIN